jgi:hypothetical protein
MVAFSGFDDRCSPYVVASDMPRERFAVFKKSQHDERSVRSS